MWCRTRCCGRSARFGQFRGGSARAWLFAIVRNCCRTAQAGAAGELSLVVSREQPQRGGGGDCWSKQPDPGRRPRKSASARPDIDRVRTAIEAIPEPFRETVVLRDLEDLSYAEIAEVTGVPIGTVMSRLSRGRAMLAKELLPRGEAGRRAVEEREMMPACADQELLLGGLVDGELDAANTALVEAHVARCEGCREELERLQAVRNLLARRGRATCGAAAAGRRGSRRCRSCSARPADRIGLPGWLAPGLAGAIAASLAMVDAASAGSTSR